MNEDEEFFDNEEEEDEMSELINKFENYVFKGEHAFFDSQDIIDLIEHYNGWMDKEMTAKAIEIGLEFFPNSPEILLKKAEILAQQSYTLDALKILNEIEPQMTHSYQYYLTKGDIYSQMGLSEQAINEYKKILSFNDFNKELIYNIIGSEYLMQNQFEEAIYYLKKSADINSINNPALYKIYFCYNELNKLEECIEYFQKVIDESPFNSDAWLYTAFCYYDLKDFQNALDTIEYALAINEGDLLIILKKSDILKELGRHQEAIDLLKETLKKDLNNNYLMNVLAESYNEMEEYEHAIHYFRKVLNNNPQDTRAWLGIAESYLNLHQDNEAIASIQQAINYCDNDPRVLLEASKLYMHLEFYEDALVLLKPLYERGFNKTEVLVWLSLALEKSGYASEAVNLLTDEIFQHQNNEPQLQYCLAAILLLYQYRQEGLKLLEKALQSDASLYPIIYAFNQYFEDDLEIQDLIQQYNN